MLEMSGFLKDALKTALIVSLSGLFVAYFQKNASESKAIRQKKGIRFLKFPFQLKLMVAVGLAFFFLFPATVIINEGYNHIVLIFFVFTIFFCFVFYQVFLCSVYWDRSGVYWRSAFGGKRCIRWDESPAFGGGSAFQSEYIQGQSTRIWYSSYCHGAKQLEKMVVRARRSRN
ncbi:MAG: hypothetical protein CFE31_15935 [Rhizobiales bacterium PAR1]|nr:MAG: hypothetical protein CFE31_15935 [Rhizobiales bacterium PAR1]